jgi:hypothetical protein
MSRPIFISIIVYISFILISWLLKLKIFFKNGNIKSFGLNQNETIFNLFIISFFISIILYLILKRIIK